MRSISLYQDHHIDESRVTGLRGLRHLVQNVLAAELKNFGMIHVVVEALNTLLYVREAVVVDALLPLCTSPPSSPPAPNSRSTPWPLTISRFWKRHPRECLRYTNAASRCRGYGRLTPFHAHASNPRHTS